MSDLTIGDLVKLNNIGTNLYYECINLCDGLQKQMKPDTIGQIIDNVTHVNGRYVYLVKPLHSETTDHWLEDHLVKIT